MRTAENGRVAFPEQTLDTAVSSIQSQIAFIDALLELGDKVKENRPQLEYMVELMRKQELNSQFYTVAEVAEALHCQTKRAMDMLRERNVEIINAGKSYVVNKDAFLDAFGRCAS